MIGKKNDKTIIAEQLNTDGTKTLIYPDGRTETYIYKRVHNNIFKNFDWVLIGSSEAGAEHESY